MSPQARKPTPAAEPEEEVEATTTAAPTGANPVYEEGLERGVLIVPDTPVPTDDE